MENTTASNSHYSLPALLSLVIPGLGQIFKSHFWRAAAMIVCFLILIGLGQNGGYAVIGMFLIIAHVVLAVWSGWDAYNAQRDWK